ncbi:MAG: hypothetical protein HND52_05970 [Ignavibacteriae bacterium]|nr:hypothetical protein [Ignavibacteriota bacterium]NOG97491.1 hypothetical protein [Ignavibacteriota bacterium]
MQESPVKDKNVNIDDQLILDIQNNHIDEKIAKFKEENVKKISLAVLLKPAIFSVFALLISFFIDLSSVPILGDVTTKIAQTLFPEWTPINKSIEPLNFWWLTPWTFALFVLLTLRAFSKLRSEVLTSNSRENVDRIIGASVSVIDAISTALPLVGAAILLVSIKMGPEIFLGFSVPFEIKALLVLAIGKLFEPVLDTLSVRFQKVVDQAIEMKETYYAKAQVELTKQMVQKIEDSASLPATAGMNASKEELVEYKTLLKEINEISKLTYRNFGATYQVLEKLTKLMSENNTMFDKFNDMSKEVGEMANKMSNENANDSLKSLKSIVSKVT